MGRRLSSADPAAYANALLGRRRKAVHARQRALETIAGVLEEHGRTVTAVRLAASPGQFSALVQAELAAGRERVAPELGPDRRTWPTAEAARRDDPLWDAIARLDAIEQRLVPKGATRLLSYLVAHHDACSPPRPRREPTLVDVPVSVADPQAALASMRGAWHRHRAITDDLAHWQKPLARLAAAANRIFAFQLLGRPGDCTMVALERGNISVEEGLVHSWKQPAIRWPDGSGHWYWRGIQLPDTLSQQLPNLRAVQVAQIQNAELRRLALDYMGTEPFLRSANATRAAQDDYGTLWRTTITIDGEPYVAVEVVNATAEPDGTYRRYFLRVPPETRTAREAVAWTFGFDDTEQYLLAGES